MRICFIGCVQSSWILLKKLLENGKQIAGVVTKEKSGIHSDFQSLIPLCEQYQVPYICYSSEKTAEVTAFVKKCGPDVLYCFGWSHLLAEEVLSIPRLGGIGFHPAALPDNKGRHPLIWALVLGLEETASTFFKLEAEADSGDIVSQEKIDILYEDDAQSLYQKILKAAERQVLDFTEYIEVNDKIPAVKENRGGNSWRRRGKADGQIDWRMSSENIYNLVRALTHPYVGAHFCYGQKEYKVWRISVCEEKFPTHLEPGKVLKFYSQNDFVVKTGNGAVHILDCEDILLQEGDYL